MKRTLKYTLVSAGILCLALAPLNKGEAVEPSFQTMLTYPEKISERIQDKRAEETENVSETGEEVADITSALPEKPVESEEGSSAAPETQTQTEKTENTEENKEDITSAPEEVPVSEEENINIQTSNEYEKRKEARLQYIDEQQTSRKTYAQIKSEIQALNPPPEPVTPAAPAATEAAQPAAQETQPAASNEPAPASSGNKNSGNNSSGSNSSSSSSKKSTSSSSSSSQTTKKAEKHSIPGQSESTSACSSSDLSTIRKYAYQNFSASKSSDLQNAAILRVNGTGSDAMDVLVDYGGEGWREYSWAEAEAKDYCIDMSDTVLKETVGNICGYIGSYSDYSNVGVGINVTKSDGVYCITIHCVFTK